MRRLTKRRVKRFFRDPLNIIGAVFTVGAFLISFLVPSSGYALFLAGVLLAGVAWLLVYLYRAASGPETTYFEEIFFREPWDSVVIRGACGLHLGEKARPEFVHAAPQNKQVNDVSEALRQSGFAILYGAPGEGKSMTAFHAAYRLYREEGYSPYMLRVQLLPDGPGPESHETLLEQLDRLEGSRKLIIVDDAHELPQKSGLDKLMRLEAGDGVLQVIWIETEFYEETISERSSSHIRIDFSRFKSELVTKFYRSPDVFVQSALQGEIEGLDEAIALAERHRIQDPWHFAFVASRGEKRVEKDISKLDDAEILVLFLISAYKVITGDAELSTAKLLNLLQALKFGWLMDALRRRTFTNIVRSLQEYRSELSPHGQTVQRASLIRLYDKTANDRNYISVLHYNFARVIVAKALSRTSIANDLTESLSNLLTADYKAATHVGVLLYSLGPTNALKVVEANEQWFVDFLSNPLPETVGGHQLLLDLLKKCDAKLHDRILRELNLDCLARSLDSIGVSELQAVAKLLHALGEHGDALLGKVRWQGFASRMEKADVTEFGQVAILLNALGEHGDALLEKVQWQGFASRVAKADVTQFNQVAVLLHALGKYGDVLVKEVRWQDFADRVAQADVAQFDQVANLLHALREHADALLAKVPWQSFASRVSKAEVTEFGQLANLLSALGEDRNALLDKVDRTLLVATANRCQGNDLTELTRFMAELDDGRRTDFIREIDWCSLAIKCPIKPDMLRALGACLENVWKKDEIYQGLDGYDNVRSHLNAREEDLVRTFHDSFANAAKSPVAYNAVAKFLANCHRIDAGLALRIVVQTVGTCAYHFYISPLRYSSIGKLIDAFRRVNPDLGRVFVENSTVQARIARSLNTHDWYNECEGARDLIRAVYRACPSAWFRVFIHLTVNMNTIGLHSLYAEVNEAAGQPVDLE